MSTGTCMGYLDQKPTRVNLEIRRPVSCFIVTQRLSTLDMLWLEADARRVRSSSRRIHEGCRGCSWRCVHRAPPSAPAPTQTDLQQGHSRYRDILSLCSLRDELYDVLRHSFPANLGRGANHANLTSEPRAYMQISPKSTMGLRHIELFVL